MIATIDFESAQPSTNCKFVVTVNDGSGAVTTYDSDGTTTEVDIKKLPVTIEVREQYAGDAS